MNRISVVLVALLALAVGAGGASWYWTNFYSQTIYSSLVMRTQADIITKVAVLERLREGRTERAIQLQEELLDGDILSAGTLARDGTTFNANTRRAVETEAKARANSGYTPDPRIREPVQEALRTVPAGESGARPAAAHAP